jgi:hypothetical protein
MLSPRREENHVHELADHPGRTCLTGNVPGPYSGVITVGEAAICLG